MEKLLKFSDYILKESFFTKKKEKDSYLEEIFREIKDSFSIENLKYDSHLDYHVIEYKLNDDIIESTCFNLNKEKYEIFINGEDFTHLVSRDISRNIFNFLHKKWQMGDRKFSKLSRVEDINEIDMP